MNYSIKKIEQGIYCYCSIIEKIKLTDVSTDKEFQRIYNGFYRMRQRTSAYYSCYYEFLENNKNNTSITFNEVLLYFYHKLGRVEASFSSKLVATIRPDMPIWDVFVLKNLGLKPPYYSDKNRIEKIIELYSSICDWYNTDEAKKLLLEFNNSFSNVPISDVKKIDFILWQSR